MYLHDAPQPDPPASSGGWSAADALRQPMDWFTTADALGNELVPAVADWCAVHVRGSVVQALRAGQAHPLTVLGLAQPVDGESLEMITFRHRDADREPVIRHWAGVTSSIVVPLRTSAGAVLGAMTLIRELDTHEALTEQDVRTAEHLARTAAEALEASRITTVTTPAADPGPEPRRTASWRPQHPRDAAVSTEGRNWARRILPEILTRQPRRDLYEDMDLVFTELISNAVRHGGGLCEAQLADTGEHLRLTAADNDPRSPAVRARRVDRPNGRGMHLIQAIADGWGVHRHHAEAGKRVWADLRFS